MNISPAPSITCSSNHQSPWGRGRVPRAVAHGLDCLPKSGYDVNVKSLTRLLWTFFFLTSRKSFFFFPRGLEWDNLGSKCPQNRKEARLNLFSNCSCLLNPYPLQGPPFKRQEMDFLLPLGAVKFSLELRWKGLYFPLFPTSPKVKGATELPSAFQCVHLWFKILHDHLMHFRAHGAHICIIHHTSFPFWSL